MQLNDLSPLALPDKLHSNHKDYSWFIILYTTFSKLFKCQNESALSVLSIILSQVLLIHSSLMRRSYSSKATP